jgi:hypothetical protein
LKQGIWMMSFIAVNLPRLASRQYPKAHVRSWRQGFGGATRRRFRAAVLQDRQG